ncbi:MAG: hypothetical protein AAFX87_05365 [Bacteroidota bacterium]
MDNQDDNTVNDRILELIEKLNFNKNSFANKIDVSATVIGNIVGGRMSKPSYEVLQRITTTFEKVNPKWLLTGEGSMFQEDPHTIVFEPIETYADREWLKEDAGFLLHDASKLLETLKADIKHKDGAGETTFKLEEIINKLAMQNQSLKKINGRLSHRLILLQEDMIKKLKGEDEEEGPSEEPSA